MDLHKLNLRTGGIIAAILAVLTGFGITLGYLQIVQGEEYALRGSLSQSTAPIAAARGVILDRNGQPLVTNEPRLSMVFEAPFFPSKGETRNKMLDSLIKLFEEHKIEWIDQLPLTVDEKGAASFIEDTKDSERDIKLLKSKDYLNLNEYATAQDCMEQLIVYYGLQDYDLQTARKIASVQFNMFRLQFNGKNPYTFSKEVTDQVKSKVMENSAFYAGIETELVPVRSYVNNSAASHTIGYVGSISPTDYEANKDKGYKLNDEYGAFGIERMAESFLRGKAGTKTVTIYNRGESTTEIEPAEQGDTVVLTVDKDLEALIRKAFPKYMAENASQRFTEIPIAGAVVVIDVRNFEILASVSYPDFDLTTFAENVGALNADESAPLFNRALEGTYEPGSTIKISVALAALQEKIINQSSTVYCGGTYRYGGHTFNCPQLYLHPRVNVNVTRAIVDSCNCFFYDMGRRLGYQQINTYRQSMGLGQKTGVELPEKRGILDSPSYRTSVNQQWYSGNNILTAIGQGNSFTPIQIAVYAATVANGGDRYQAHYIRSIRKAGTNEIVQNFVPEKIGSTGIDQAHYETVRSAMRDMAYSQRSSTYRHFKDLPVQIGAKTGTSQVYRTVNGKYQKFNNGIFISFAPYDNPEIAVIAVGEGCKAAMPLMPTVRDVYQYYFGSLDQMKKPQQENVLL